MESCVKMNYQEFYDEMNQHYYRANCYHTMKDPDKDCTSGNHHVLNATYHLISSKLGNLTKEDELKEVNFINSTELEPGLFNRHPDKVNDQETQDDYIGLEVTDILMFNLNPGVSDYIYKYGLDHKWYYDNLKGSFSLGNWFGRFPWFPALVKKGACQPLNWFNRIGYCLYLLSTVYFNKDRTDTSGRILQWLANSVMKSEGKLIDYCIRKWEDKIKVDYPTGYMGEVLGIYHGVEHPFSKAMWKEV